MIYSNIIKIYSLRTHTSRSLHFISNSCYELIKWFLQKYFPTSWKKFLTYSSFFLTVNQITTKKHEWFVVIGVNITERTGDFKVSLNIYILVLSQWPWINYLFWASAFPIDEVRPMIITFLGLLYHPRKITYILAWCVIDV